MLAIGVLNPVSAGTLLAMIGLQEPKKGATVAMKMDEVTAAESTVELMARGKKDPRKHPRKV